MNLTQLKKHLKNLDATDLQEVIVHIYNRSKDAKNLLGVYFNQIDENGIFESASEKLEKCFRKNGQPAPRDPKIKDARTIIRDYERLFPNSLKILDLKIDFSFYLAELLSEFGGGDEAWENSMCSMFEACCMQVKEQNLGSSFQQRLKKICITLNRNYPEILDDYYNEYFDDKL